MLTGLEVRLRVHSIVACFEVGISLDLVATLKNKAIVFVDLFSQFLNEK